MCTHTHAYRVNSLKGAQNSQVTITVSRLFMTGRGKGTERGWTGEGGDEGGGVSVGGGDFEEKLFRIVLMRDVCIPLCVGVGVGAVEEDVLGDSVLEDGIVENDDVSLTPTLFPSCTRNVTLAAKSEADTVTQAQADTHTMAVEKEGEIHSEGGGDTGMRMRHEVRKETVVEMMGGMKTRNSCALLSDEAATCSYSLEVYLVSPLARLGNLAVWLCADIHTYIYIYIYMCVYKYIYILQVWLCGCINIHIYIHKYVCTYVYMYLYIYIHTCVHINMYIFKYRMKTSQTSVIISLFLQSLVSLPPLLPPLLYPPLS